MGQHHVRASCSTTLSAGPRPLPPLPIAPKHSGIGADGRVGREGFNYETEGLTFADFDVGVEMIYAEKIMIVFNKVPIVKRYVVH